MMPLQVYTARITYGGADALDITRKTADRDPSAPGRWWAPSWSIVREAKAGSAHATRLRELRNPAQADRIAAQSWARYEERYRQEMLASYRLNRAAWDELLARESVTLCCFCPSPGTCHRRLLAGYLGQLGAMVHGERTGRCEVAT